MMWQVSGHDMSLTWQTHVADEDSNIFDDVADHVANTLAWLWRGIYVAADWVVFNLQTAHEENGRNFGGV